MTDIVERLRYCQHHGLLAAVDKGKHCSYGEAADEIEELRGILAQEVDTSVRYRMEIAHLRKALFVVGDEAERQRKRGSNSSEACASLIIIRETSWAALDGDKTDE